MNFAAILVIVLGFGAGVLACAGLDRRETRFAMAAFALHVVASFGQWALHEFYYGFGDAMSYQEEGVNLARFVDYDFPRYAPELVKLVLHIDARLPCDVFGEGASSGTMAGISGLLVFVLGPSLLTLCLVTSWLSWFGQVCWYRIAREELPTTDRTAALVGMMLVPSVIFWGAVFAKEALVLAAFGALGLSTYRVIRNRRLYYLPGVVVGGLGVAMLKPYTLLPFVIAVGAFVYADRAWRTEGALRIRPAYLLLAGALSVGGVAAFVTAFPQYNAENLVDTVSHQQQAWDMNAGGSTIERIGGESTTGAQQLQLAPLALLNSLFRPFIFEARGGPALGAGVETTLFVLVSLSLLSSGRAAARAALSSPLLVACIAFVLVFAFAVGVTTSNLGTLSRYRVPMMPFYAMVLLVLRGRAREPAAAVRVRAPMLASRRRSPT